MLVDSASIHNECRRCKMAVMYADIDRCRGSMAASVYDNWSRPIEFLVTRVFRVLFTNSPLTQCPRYSWIIYPASVYFLLKYSNVKLIQLVKRVFQSRKFGIRWWICRGYRRAFEADHCNITRFVVIVSTNNCSLFYSQTNDRKKRGKMWS